MTDIEIAHRYFFSTMLYGFVKVAINTWVYCAFGNVYLVQEGLAVAVPQVEGKTFTTRRKRFQIFYLKLIVLRKLQNFRHETCASLRSWWRRGAGGRWLKQRRRRTRKGTKKLPRENWKKNKILMKMKRWRKQRRRRTRNEKIKVECKNQNLRGNKSLMFALILLIWIWRISMNTLQYKREEKENSQLPILR